MAVAAVASFSVAQFLDVPLAGLWAVLTSVVVSQMSLGGSLKATIEYFAGTLGGALYAGVLAAVVPHDDRISVVAVLALAVAPPALLAAINPHFRVAPFTAVTVVLGGNTTHLGAIGSAFYRVIPSGRAPRRTLGFRAISENSKANSRNQWIRYA
jgi:uncharacterized membrane protein YccC